MKLLAGRRIGPALLFGSACIDELHVIAAGFDYSEFRKPNFNRLHLDLVLSKFTFKVTRQVRDYPPVWYWNLDEQRFES